MANRQINRCVWLVDTIRRYGRITRAELSSLWERSPMNDTGRGFPRRTFYNYRDTVEEMFNLRIECDPTTFEYYIDEEELGTNGITDWMLNSLNLHETLSGAHQIADRIVLEDVPSAREHLSTVIEALKLNRMIKFDYHPYTRTIPTRDVVLCPYFIKLFKQRWYVVGLHMGENRIKTYALDRMIKIVALAESFTSDPSIDPKTYFEYSYGIVVEQHSEPRKVVLKVEARQAKYFAALPLHHSQMQTVADGYSLFTYHMRISSDFIEELLSHGHNIEVLEPKELRALIRTELEDTLNLYK